jgi:crotonobetainyl-CoA:carnitine CoA-transferase CaiB-like acyl-CoA transferase
LRRERTGRGSRVEVAQIEAVTGMLGELLLKAGLEPGSGALRGNKNERGSPWGIYPLWARSSGVRSRCATTRIGRICRPWAPDGRAPRRTTLRRAGSAPLDLDAKLGE